MTGYYAEKLSGTRLKACYELASPRVKQYLEAEIQHVLDRLKPTDSVLELGCGYGRVTYPLAEIADRVVGIDTAGDSLELARRDPRMRLSCVFFEMNALDLSFEDDAFDAVVCVQNGICAFQVDQIALVREAIRVTKPGGTLFLSTYSDRFWPHRLAWFRAQSEAGLLGPIDESACGHGVIVCKDGFRAGRLTPRDWDALCAPFGCPYKIVEVDNSSVFCEILKIPSANAG